MAEREHSTGRERKSLFTTNHTSASSHKVPRGGYRSWGTERYRPSGLAPTFAEHRVASKSYGKSAGPVYCLETTLYADRPNHALQILICARCGYTQLVLRPTGEAHGL